jgi:hypothetical protein
MTGRRMSLALAAVLAMAPICISQSAGPVQISPSDGAVLDNGCSNGRDPIQWEFHWSLVAGAQVYRFYIKRMGSVKKLFDIQTNSTSYVRNGVGSYIAPFNLDGWRWSVRALVNGQWTAWSTSNFSVEPLDTDCPRPK